MEKLIEVYCQTRRSGARWDISFCGMVDGDETQELFGGGDQDLWDLPSCKETTIKRAIIKFCKENEFNYSLKMMKSDNVKIYIK